MLECVAQLSVLSGGRGRAIALCVEAVSIVLRMGVTSLRVRNAEM